MSAFPDAPPNLKSIQPYLKIAIEHEQRDLVGKLNFNKNFHKKINCNQSLTKVLAKVQHRIKFFF